MNKDLDIICATAQEVHADSSISNENKPFEFLSLLAKKDLSKSTIKFLNELSVKERSSYEDFQVFASENSNPEWECDDLKKILELSQ